MATNADFNLQTMEAILKLENSKGGKVHFEEIEIDEINSSEIFKIIQRFRDYWY